MPIDGDVALDRIGDIDEVVIERQERADQPTMTAMGCASRRKPVKNRIICSCSIVW